METRRDAVNQRLHVSNRKQAEATAETRYLEAAAALRKSEDEKQAILDGLRGLVIVRYLSPDFRIIWSNTDSVEGRVTGDPEASPIYCYESIRGRKEVCPHCDIRATLETGQFSENEESTPTPGEYFITRGIPVRGEAGSLLGAIHIALNITKHRQTEEGLKASNEFFHSLIGNLPTPICLSDREGRIATVNEAWEKTLGFKREQVVGGFLHEIFSADVADSIRATHRKVLQSGIPIELEESIGCPTGLRHFHTVKFPLQDPGGQTVVVGTISVDVTARKRAEQDLTEREAELEIKSEQLSEMNTALRVLLRQGEQEQKELEERVLSNVRELVLPYVRKLKAMHPNDIQASYLEIVETHLNDIVAPFMRQIVSQYPHMTAKELQVATHIREGKANKEIANLMNVSLNTIEIHRYNLRKKLGLQNKKINLRSYLLSLNSLPAQKTPTLL